MVDTADSEFFRSLLPLCVQYSTVRGCLLYMIKLTQYIPNLLRKLVQSCGTPATYRWRSHWLVLFSAGSERMASISAQISDHRYFLTWSMLIWGRHAIEEVAAPYDTNSNNSFDSMIFAHLSLCEAYTSVQLNKSSVSVRYDGSYFFYN